MSNNLTHEGQKIKELVKSSGCSVSFIAKSLGVSRRTLYLWFKTPDLPLYKVYSIGYIMRLSQAALSNLEDSKFLAEPNEERENQWANHYSGLLKKHLKALERIIRLQERLLP